MPSQILKNFGADYFYDSLRTRRYDDSLVEKMKYFLKEDFLNWLLVVFFTIFW